MLFDLETFEIPSGLPAEAQASLVSSPKPTPLAITNADTSVAFVLDGVDDAVDDTRLAGIEKYQGLQGCASRGRYVRHKRYAGRHTAAADRYEGVGS